MYIHVPDFYRYYQLHNYAALAITVWLLYMHICTSIDSKLQGRRESRDFVLVDSSEAHVDSVT